MLLVPKNESHSTANNAQAGNHKHRTNSQLGPQRCPKPPHFIDGQSKDDQARNKFGNPILPGHPVFDCWIAVTRDGRVPGLLHRSACEEVGDHDGGAEYDGEYADNFAAYFNEGCGEYSGVNGEDTEVSEGMYY